MHLFRSQFETEPGDAPIQLGVANLAIMIVIKSLQANTSNTARQHLEHTAETAPQQ